MTDTEDLLETLAAQEKALVFSTFNESTALQVGLAIVQAAQAQYAPVVIDIRTPNRTLFHAALPGSAPDNDEWARRKSNTTLRFHRASFAVGEGMRQKGRTPGPDIGIDLMEYATHGGSFPVRVEGVGVVAAITVSGLAQAEDHQMIVDALEQYLAQ
jgi:uncharacterized protein (UPF0303 family)